MRLNVAVLLLTFLLSTATGLWAMGDASDKASATFHLETEAGENPKMVFSQQVGGRERFFRRVPEVGTKDIATFSPFPNEGGDFGVAFRLKGNAARRLSAITAANQGRWLIASLNGRPLDAVLIDAQIDDGVLVIWKGVTLADIDILDKSLPRAGEQADGKKEP
jgi:hypothetical protein